MFVVSRRLRVRAAALMLSLVFSAHALAGESTKAATFYEDGLKRYETGDLAGAVIQLKNALQQNPKMLTAHVLLGRTLLEDLQFQAADAAFGKALELGVSPREIAAPRARLLMSLGRSKQLLAEISPDGLMGDDLVEVLTLRAKAKAMEGDAAAARGGYVAAIESNPRSVQPYLEYVPFLIQRGELDEAERMVEALRQAAPNDARTWNLVASMDHARGRLKAALAGYDRALSLDPKHVDARVARAAVRVDLGQDAEAGKDLDYLAQTAKREPRSAYLRSLVATRTGRVEEAKVALRDVAELINILSDEYVNANEQLLMLGGLSNNALGAREKAKEYFDRLLRRYPSNRGARKVLASIYLDEGDSTRALSAVEPVLQNSPDDPQANVLAGRAHLGMKRFRRATEHLERATKRLDDQAEAFFALGLSLIGERRAVDGLPQLEKAVQLDSGNLVYASALVSVLMNAGRSTEALDQAKRFAHSSRDSAEALNLVASVYIGTGDLDAARKTLNSAVAGAPGLAAVQLNLARVERLAGNPAAAEAVLNAWLTKHPEDGRAMFELGLCANLRGETELAIQWLRKAVAKQPDQAEPALALVEALSRKQDHTDALNAAKEIALRRPEDLSVQAVLAQAYLAVGDRKSSRQTLRNMTRIADFDGLEQVRIGRLALANGFPDDAQYNVSKAILSDQNYAPAYALAIDVALEQSSPEKAQDSLSKLRQLAPEYPDLLRYEGMVALAGGDEKRALAAFKKRYGQTPTAESAINLSRLYQRNGMDKEAEGLLRSEVARAGAMQVVDALAQLLEQRRDPSEALEVYGRLIDRAPDHPDLLRRYALLLLRSGDAQALTMVERAFKLAADVPSVIDSTGWIRLKSGDVSGGLALLREARLRMPGNPEYRYHLAEALAKAGRTGEAVAELRVALERTPNAPWAEDARALQSRLDGR